jgi:hypothetical protein
LYLMGKIAATFPFQSTVPGDLYAGIASTSHNMEIPTFFQLPHTIHPSARRNANRNVSMNACIIV